ncbi:MAG: hypothetical protein MHM6MM_008160, partial [Cercozoa sp. M6MM]
RFEGYRTRDHLLGQRQRVLCCERARDGKHLVSHNKSYDQVLVPMREDLLGKMFDVEIVECGKHFLKARVIENSVTATVQKDPSSQQGLESRRVATAETHDFDGAHEKAKTNFKKRQKEEKRRQAAARVQVAAREENSEDEQQQQEEEKRQTRLQYLLFALLVLLVASGAEWLLAPAS